MPLGQGTEKKAEEFCASASAAPIFRVDQDSMGRKHAMQALLDQVHSGASCILVGTQMLAKGITFPPDTGGDSGRRPGLLSGDFRATERLGQLITQVAGRAGRAALPATRCCCKPTNPDHPLMQCLLEQNYSRYAQMLLNERRQVGKTPFGALALIRLEDKNSQKRRFFNKIRQHAEQIAPPAKRTKQLSRADTCTARKAQFALPLSIAPALQHQEPAATTPQTPS